MIFTADNVLKQNAQKVFFRMVRGILQFALILVFILPALHAQPQFRAGGRDDTEVARQYIEWIRQAINEERMEEAHAALERAVDFANVSSDITYELALIQTRLNSDRNIIIGNLIKSIETNRWEIYSEDLALLLTAEHYIVMRKYLNALDCLEPLYEHPGASGERRIAAGVQTRADAAMLRLMALRGLTAGNTAGYDPVLALAQFRSEVLTAMDRFPRDPRPLRIFFEYAANNRRPSPPAAEEWPFDNSLPAGDIDLLELAQRRLVFILDTDPELAFLAAPFIRDMETARQLVASYRAMIKTPNPASIPVALNLGLIDDDDAITELFTGISTLNKDVLINVYNLLRSEEGRSLFTQRLLSFSGIITADEDRDGYIDSRTHLNSGVVTAFEFDRDQNNIYDLKILFNTDGFPESAVSQVAVHSSLQRRSAFETGIAHISWERFPFVKRITINSVIFDFGPADFNYLPLTFREIGGSNNIAGLVLPYPAHQYIELTSHMLLSFCSSLTRPSLEIDGAMETIYMNRGVLLQAVEMLNGRQVSVTEFSNGLPLVQHIDLDLDGRMETIRRFRRPLQDYVWHDILDYRRLIESSESDFAGDGRHKTMEVYLPDGSVVYYFDMDGSGTVNYHETGTQR
ncbi:MAG: hypothetical protein FWD40_12170 [Treponema sp.]|nr:hypothetical protein [Treponema sp.]